MLQITRCFEINIQYGPIRFQTEHKEKKKGVAWERFPCAVSERAKHVHDQCIPGKQQDPLLCDWSWARVMHGSSYCAGLSAHHGNNASAAPAEAVVSHAMRHASLCLCMPAF